MELTDRKQKILVAIIEKYIESGEPVGSKTLSEAFGNTVSPATIRNDMADLASLGFLIQPHASAGRIPSPKGYRYYVDRLMSKKDLGDTERKAIEATLLSHGGEPEQLLEDASALLAQMTNCVAIATTLSDENETVSKIELMPLGKSTLLLVVISSSGLIKNRVCRLSTDVSDTLVEQFRSVVSEHFIGVPVNEIGTVTIQTVAASLGSAGMDMYPLLIALSEMLREISERGVLLEGESNILGFESAENAKSLMQFLSSTEGIKNIISEEKGGLSVVIGSENPHKELRDSSLIIARYKIDGNDAGALGIIGSTRIDYAKLIPHIEYLTDLVGRLLSDVIE